MTARATAMERAGRRCETCGASGDLVAHHLVYERTERPEHYRILCRRCHDRVHRQAKGPSRRENLKRPTSVRLSAEGIAGLSWLAERFGLSQASVIELLIRERLRAEKRKAE